jgi:UDP-glucuronate decarboxylase
MHRIIEEDLSTISKGLGDLAKKIEDSTFLITGGAGFLGSWVCDTIIQNAGRVICADNYDSGSRKNIEHLFDNPDFSLIKQDIAEPLEIDSGIDYIIHMASVASPGLYQKKMIETLDSNLIGTRNLLELAKEKNARGFLFTSTSEVYGHPKEEWIDAGLVPYPFPEDYYGYVNSFGPRCMYDEGKRGAEAYCYSYINKHQLPIRIARIFNTYGPRLDIEGTSLYGRALIKFVDQALKNKDFTIYGGGEQTRAFCYVTDQIEGLLRLLLTEGLGKDEILMNIGNGSEEKSILKLTDIIKDLTGSKSGRDLDSPADYNIEDDPRRRRPDTSKARGLIGFEPKVKLEEGLLRAIEWYRETQL